MCIRVRLGVRLPGPEWRRQDDVDPDAARADTTDGRNDEDARTPDAEGTLAGAGASRGDRGRADELARPGRYSGVPRSGPGLDRRGADARSFLAPAGRGRKDLRPRSDRRSRQDRRPGLLERALDR